MHLHRLTGLLFFSTVVQSDPHLDWCRAETGARKDGVRMRRRYGGRRVSMEEERMTCAGCIMVDLSGMNN